jgi:transcriptional regulator with XRE-family HTH domain
LLLGRRLRASRLVLGFDAQNFAEELGLMPEVYARIELGKKEPPLGALIRAAKITGKSLDFLLTGRSFSKAA